MIGILAFGSLITDPGWEIEEFTAEVIPGVETPFPVEYARRSTSRAGAPTLVPVPPEYGCPVQAQIIMLKKDIPLQLARDMLYRRELNRPGDLNKPYPTRLCQKPNRVVIVELSEFAGLERVLYTRLGVNFPEIVDPTFDGHEKPELLSVAARDSLTEKTFFTGRDGIQYLAAAIQNGINTPLTDIYRFAIMQLAVASTACTKRGSNLPVKRGLFHD